MKQVCPKGTAGDSFKQVDIGQGNKSGVQGKVQVI
jgi:hypothetical protein